MKYQNLDTGFRGVRRHHQWEKAFNQHIMGFFFYAKDIKQNKCYELRSPHKRDRKSKYLSKDYGGKKAALHPYGPLITDVVD